MTAGSDRKLLWACAKGHQWEAAVSGRVRGSGCPVCSGKKVLLGYNDLATAMPHLVQELIRAEEALEVTAHSDRRLEWACKTGHTWVARVHDRTLGYGCPYCSGKRVLPGFNDMATTHPQLAAMLADPKIGTRLQANSNKKSTWRCELGHTWDAQPCSVLRYGKGCPYCSGRTVLPGFNDLATKHPDLAAQLVDQSLGGEMSTGSRKPVDWVCAQGHTWQATPCDRARGSGCLYCCNQRVLPGFNDLATTHPHLVCELADPETAMAVLAGSDKKVPWVCSAGHRWTAKLNARARGVGCPNCAKYGFKNDVPATLYFLKALIGGREVNQYGITNCLNIRLARHARSGFTKEAGTLAFHEGWQAREVETAIKRGLSSRISPVSAVGSSPRFEGWTESFYNEDLPCPDLRQLLEALSITVPSSDE